MRFISNIRQYGIQVRPLRSMVLATGQEQVMQDGIYIKFREGDLSSHEIEAARNHFSLHGFKLEADEVTPVPVLTRLSSFDTDLEAEENNWDEEMKALVEDTLMDRATNTHNVLYVPSETLAPPWPTFDKFSDSVEALIQRLTEDEHNLSDALRYERQNQNRPEIVGAITKALEEQEADIATREFIGA